MKYEQIMKLIKTMARDIKIDILRNLLFVGQFLSKEGIFWKYLKSPNVFLKKSSLFDTSRHEKQGRSTFSR